MCERGALGSALWLVVILCAALTALGLGLLSLGSLEISAARDALAARQASYAAEAGLRLVKHWFDAPAGCAHSWRVPAATEVDRSLRRVDADGDGVHEPIARAPAPWNVEYRRGRDDLFDRSYRGDPSLSLEGDALGPDIVIASDSQRPAARAYLASLSESLFGDGPAPNLALRLTRIAVFGPPVVRMEGRGVRAGIASIEVTAALVRPSAGSEMLVASARASGVLQEVPCAAPGPLVAGCLEDGEGLDARWGAVLVSGDASLGANPARSIPAGWPWRSPRGRLVADGDRDGTADDADGDGTSDLHEWLSLPDRGLGDPWFRLLVAGRLEGADTAVQQPFPFDPSLIPGTYRTDLDRSGLFHGVSIPSGVDLGSGVLRSAAAEGGAGARLFHYVAGSSPPLFSEGGQPPVSFEEATKGKQGFFYFDTIDSLLPADKNGDGTPDNLTPAVSISDPDWWARGCLVVNAASVRLGALGQAAVEPVSPPGEPCADLGGDGQCGDNDPFLKLAYPPEPLAPGAVFDRIELTSASAGASRTAAGPTRPTPVTFAGVLLTPGSLVGPSGARIFGAVVAGGAVRAPETAAGERLQILYDERLSIGQWPACDARLPRTAWQGRAVSF